jgi:hypothetical protein
MRKIAEYYWVVTKRVIIETLGFFSLNAQTSILYIVLYLLGIWSITVIRGSQAAVEQLAFTIVFSFIPIVIAVVLVLVIQVIRAPVLMYEKLGGFEKLKLVVEPELRAGGWLTFVVKNQSTSDIRECYAVLETVSQESDPHYKIGEPVYLLWSSENPPIKGRQDIPAGGNRRIDVASADQDMDMMGFEVQNGIRHLSKPGNYHARIVFRGIHGITPFACPFSLDFEYRGGRAFACAKHEQDIILIN